MPLRVLHCPTIVGGNPSGLAAAERELGLESTTVAFRHSPYGYPVDEVVWDNGDGVVVREAKRWSLLARAIRDFDVVHFNGGATIAPHRVALDRLDPERAARLRTRTWATYAGVFEQLDLPLLARAGKAIFVTFQGSDARQGDIAERFAVDGFAEAARAYSTPALDQIKRRRIARFDRYADAIYTLNPDLLRVLPGRARFVPYAHVDAGTWEPPAPAGAAERPLVLHAPTNPAIKGTRFVVEAVSRLRAEGIEFDFQLVQDLTHAEAKRLYRRADLVVDQLVVGWYGGLAVELMALERPVVAYLRAEDLALVPTEMRAELPVISADATTVYQVLKELLTTRRDELAEIGRRGRAYVRRWHDPLAIAQQLAMDYDSAVAASRSRRSKSPSE